MAAFENDDIPETECVPLRDEPSRPAAGPWWDLLLWMPPGLIRPLALVLALVVFSVVAWSMAAVPDGVASIVRLRTRGVLGATMAGSLVLWALSRRLRRERWHGSQVDRGTLLAPFVGATVALVVALAWPPAVLFAWGCLAVAAAHILPWPWGRRVERAWLLNRPGYARGLLASVLLLALPAPLLAVALRSAAPRLAERARAIEVTMSHPGADCLPRLLEGVRGSVWDRLALLAQGARSGLRLGDDLAQCLAPQLAEDEESGGLVERLEWDSGALCTPGASGHNRGVFADWFERRDRLRSVHWMIESFAPDQRTRYHEALRALAGPSAACGDPLQVPRALLLDAADPLGALQGCGGRFARAAPDEWVRQALHSARGLGAATAYTAPEFPLTGGGWSARARERPSPHGVVRTRPVEAVLLRPRDAERDFEVALHLRWLSSAEVTEKLNPWMERHQRGNEIYLVDCAGRSGAAARLDALRDAWGFADRRLMGTDTCPRSFGRTAHHVLPLPGGRQFVVARHRTLRDDHAELRLVYTETDPCRR